MSFIVKNTTLLNPFDLLAPHSCRGCGRLGEVLCDRCKKYIISAEHGIRPKKCPDSIPIYSLGKREDLLATLIHDFKYHSVRTIGVKLAELLNEALPELPKGSMLVPLPTSTKHIRARGFDHTLFIAKRLATKRGLKLEKILLRVKNTVQVGADQKTREAQASSAYEINQKIKINPDKTYVLFDDVWTTGSSMLAAAKKLREAGAQNFIFVLLGISRLD